MLLCGDQRSMSGVFPSCSPPYFFETWSLTVVTNLGCQFNWIWNQQQQNASCFIFLIRYLKWEDSLKVDCNFWWQLKEQGRRKFASVCLPSFPLTNLCIPSLHHFLTNSGTDFFGVPTWAEVQRLPKNPPSLQCQTGTSETSNLIG